MTDPAPIAAAGSVAATSATTPGARLAQARIAQGLPVEGVAQQLKFSARQIEALEADRYEQLPGIAVVRGMVRGYARLVGVEAEPLLEALRGAMPAPDAGRIVDRYREPVPFSDATKRSNLVYVVFTLAVLAVAALVLVQWRQDRPESEARMSFVVPATEPQTSERTTVASAGGALPVPQAGGTPSAEAAAPAERETAGAPASVSQAEVRDAADAPRAAEGAAAAPAADRASETASAGTQVAAATAPGDASAPAAGTPTAPGMQRVQLEFLEEAWVEIHDADGKRLHAQLNAAGSAVQATGKAPLSFVIGNAQSVRLTVDGRSVDLTPYIKVAVARFTLP
jgi:cytoskeleton protein RodZ